jgi:glutamate-1-semialdehyde 2,1-aminomutase
MRAGIETLSIIDEQPDFYSRLESLAAALERGVEENIAVLGLPLTQNRVGSMFTLFFSRDRIVNFDGAKRCDTRRFGVYFHEMLARGIYLAPSQFEAAFLSIAHTADEIARTIEVNREALRLAFT